MVNCAIAQRSCGDTLGTDVLQRALANGMDLQFFSDGGFNGCVGAFAVQCIGHLNGQQHRIGHSYTFIADARSAFEMELLGLDAAVHLTWAATVKSRTAKRVRFA